MKFLKKHQSLIGIYALITVSSLSLLIIFQQFLRIEADEDPTNRATSVATLLSQGASPDIFISDQIGELGHDSSFLLIADASGNTLASTAYLNDHPLSIPSGVFEYTKNHGTHHVTWSPTKKIRQAATITPYSNQATGEHGYVAAGESLEETEDIIHRLSVLIGLSWLSLMTIATLFFAKKS